MHFAVTKEKRFRILTRELLLNEIFLECKKMYKNDNFETLKYLCE